MSPCPAERPDQVPLAHLRTTRDPLALGDVVQLRARPILVVVSWRAAPRPGPCRLTPEVTPNGRGQMRDGPFRARGACRLADVPSCRLHLFGGRHDVSPPWIDSLLLP